MTFRELVEVNKEEQLYKKLIKILKQEGIKYTEKTKVQGQPRVFVGKYFIGSGSVYHDQYTIFEDKGTSVKELKSTTDIEEVLNFIKGIK